MASIKQIASDIGVSAATVSNALSGKGRVSAELVEHVRQRAQELGYRPSAVARALKTGRTGILGLVMPDLTNPLFPRMAQTLSAAADRRKLGILIADSRGSASEQSEALRRLVDRGVDGLLVVPQRGTSPEPQPVPTVVINTVSDPLNTVSADHRGGGAQLAAHIGDIGHRKVLLLGGDPLSEVQRDRIAGMRAGLPAACEARELWGDAGIAELAQAIAEGFTAVMTTSDMLALKVRSALHRSGLSVPEDASLTGFDDLPLAVAMHPPLTTAAQDVEQIADRAIDAIINLIAGTPIRDPGHIVPMRLVVRDSTAIPRR